MALGVTSFCAACALEGAGSSKDPGREAYLTEFRRIDVAGRGQITMEEARAYYARRFGEIDRNRDGYLTPDEFQSELPFINATRPSDLMDRLDRNGDGRISLEEYQVAANWLFRLARGNTLALRDVQENELATTSGSPRQRDFGGTRMKGM